MGPGLLEANIVEAGLFEGNLFETVLSKDKPKNMGAMCVFL
jgi:hypothetical protein